MPIKLVHIAVVGNEELVSGLRLAGVSKYYMIKGDGDVGEDVRKALEELIVDPDVGLVVMLEDYAQYVGDLLTRVRQGKAITPIIIEAPSKSGSKYPDVAGYYKTFVRDFIGFDVEI